MKPQLFYIFSTISIIFGLVFLLFFSKSNRTKIFLALFFIFFFPVIFYIIQNPNRFGWLFNIGIALGSILLILILINVHAYKKEKIFIFWTIPTIVLLSSIFLVMIFSNHTFLDFVFYVGLGIGIALLSSGVYWKLFGLVIPGCLLAGIAPGIFFAWAGTNDQNGLVRTGIMLVWFALGWGLVTIFARVQTLKFVWWPLIPGGILAMVGWGLYIGGNPSNAVGFIGNTGSIGLLIFGIYILLLRRGIHH